MGDPMKHMTKSSFETHFSTYFMQRKSEPEDVAELLRGFWDIDRYGIEQSSNELLSPIDKEIKIESERSIKVVDNRYEVAIPWKTDSRKLENNYKMALRRLKLTEKRIEKEPILRESYEKTIESYLEKGYTRKVSRSKKKPVEQWYLPHFPVVRMDKETTKVRIVSDAAAKYDDVCLNDMIHEGPKLQTELFDVLLRFRKNPVAIVCDISEMYLRVQIKGSSISSFLMEQQRRPTGRV